MHCASNLLNFSTGASAANERGQNARCITCVYLALARLLAAQLAHVVCTVCKYHEMLRVHKTLHFFCLIISCYIIFLL